MESSHSRAGLGRWGPANDRRPRGAPQSRDVARSLGLPRTLGKSHLGEPRKAGLSPGPVLSVFPSSFVMLPGGCFFPSLLWGLWSFTRWTLGSGLPGACLLPADPGNFLADPLLPPSSQPWPASASAACFSAQMETPRWPRGSRSRAPGGGGRRTRRTNLLCTRLCPSCVLAARGFQEINSNGWDPELCLFIPLPPPLPSLELYTRS